MLSTFKQADLVTKLAIPDGQTNTFLFGKSVSIDGDTLIVGKPRWADDEAAAYVYSRSNCWWTLQH